MPLFMMSFLTILVSYSIPLGLDSFSHGEFQRYKTFWFLIPLGLDSFSHREFQRYKSAFFVAKKTLCLES